MVYTLATIAAVVTIVCGPFGTVLAYLGGRPDHNFWISFRVSRHSPYTSMKGVVAKYGVARLRPGDLRAVVSTSMTSVWMPGTETPYGPDDVERLVGDSPQTRDTHYVLSEYDQQLPPLRNLDYHAWGGVRYHSPLQGPFVGPPAPRLKR